MASVLATVSQRRWKTRMTCLFEVTDRGARQLSQRLCLCAGTSRVVRGGLPGGDVRLRFLDWCELIRGIIELLSSCGASRCYARWLVFGTVAAGSTHSDSTRALDASWDWALWPTGLGFRWNPEGSSVLSGPHPEARAACGPSGGGWRFVDLGLPLAPGPARAFVWLQLAGWEVGVFPKWLRRTLFCKRLLSIRCAGRLTWAAALARVGRAVDYFRSSLQRRVLPKRKKRNVHLFFFCRFVLAFVGGPLVGNLLTAVIRLSIGRPGVGDPACLFGSRLAHGLDVSVALGAGQGVSD